jgi:hypothetical protein
MPRLVLSMTLGTSFPQVYFQFGGMPFDAFASLPQSRLIEPLIVFILNSIP